MEIKKPKICIICEGNEEFDYITAIINLNIWNNYDIVPINAKSIGNIYARYTNTYQADKYYYIFIFGDTDLDRKQYDEIKRKIDCFHDKKGVAEQIYIFGNPCTMQIILQHFSDKTIYVKKASKAKNASLIEELTGIQNYDAHEEQRKEMMSLIRIKNYSTMKDNLSNVSRDDRDLSSTNFLDMAEKLERKENKWIDEFNKYLSRKKEVSKGRRDKK